MSPMKPFTSFMTPLLASIVLLPLQAEGTKPAAKQVPTKAQRPPVLDRELFFGNPEISGAQISPDGQYIAFLKPWKDTRNVWVKKVGEPYSSARILTAEPKRPIPGFFWSRDGKYVLFVKDKDGDENFNVYAVDPKASPEAGQDAPSARNLTDAKSVQANIYSLPKNDPDTIYVGLNDRDTAWHDLYKVKISTGERTLMRKNTERIAGWFFDMKGNLRMALRTTDKGDTEILRVDPDTFTKVYECSVFESAGPVRFHKDGKRVYMETNKGARNLSQLVLFDPETGKEELVEKDPLNHVDFGSPIFSEVTDELQATVYNDAKERIYFRDKGLEADYKLIKSKLPGQEIALTSSTADEQIFMIAAHSDTDPGSRYLFNRKTKKLTLEYVARERLPREDMAAMKPIHYTSSDGLEIPAYLTLPKGVPAKNLPVVINPHGGPWYRDSWGFNNEVQFLANRGYAVLQMNFRGSTGYGKAFLNAGNKQWGEKMQDDITWGVKYLVKQGIADPKHVGIYGASYGGYATLAGVTFTPGLYTAAVDYVGVSNMLTFMNSIPPYWEAFRTILKERVGDASTPEGKKQLERQSPINSADKIKTPLLVVQGANDPRVNRAESEQIVISLRDRKYPVEYMCAPDEGHGFHRPVNSMAMYAATETFFAKYLGGRCQEGGTPQVMQRLKEITVDPATVKLTPKVDLAAVGLPKPASDLAAGSAAYAGTLAVQGQHMPVSGTTTIKEEGPTWVITEVMKLPMGEATDVTTVEKGTLAVRQRSIKQGPVTIDLAFKDGKASGKMSMGGQDKPLAADIGGELFADGAGSSEVLAHLPLAAGYAATFRNFDPMKQKVALKQVKVLGLEDVKVPAGFFHAWKAEVSSAEGEAGTTTLWVDPVSRKVLKMAVTVPEMGGAVITQELQP